MRGQRLPQLLDAVVVRQQLGRVATRFHQFVLGAAGLYFVALLVVRLTGLLPDWLTPVTLLAVPAVALLGALVCHRRPTAADAARAVDLRTQSSDLFLTATLIDTAGGEYQPVVLAAAEERAATVRPAQVAPLGSGREALWSVAALTVLAAAVWWLPQLDPFGKHKARERLAQQQERLRETVRATQARAALLQQQPANAATEQTKAAIAELLQTFNQMKPSDKAGNLAKLNEQQKELGQLWRTLNDEKLKSPLAQPSGQSIGAGDPVKLAQWKNDLQKGETGSLLKELGDLKDLAQRLAAATDPVERAKLQQELTDRLRGLADALAQQANSPPLNAALQRALEQLQMAAQQGMSAEALQALAESVNLSEAELQQLAQGIRNMQDLEQALKAIQMAKRANDGKPLDGEQGKNCNGVGDYEALYAAALAGMLGGAGDQPGVGMGGGIGTGARPTAEDTLKTGFKPEQAPSAFQPGEILMQWKTRGLTDPGQAKIEFERAWRDVRQKASEAIVQEQIPPAYHGTIQKYFDALHDQAKPPATP